MRPARTALAAAALAFLGGCMTYRATTEWKDIHSDGSSVPRLTIQIENSGWYLFDCIPIVSGNPDKPNGNSCKWFTNTVTLQNNLIVLDHVMAENNCNTMANVVSRTTDDFYYFFLLYRRACHTSAVLFRESDQN